MFRMVVEDVFSITGRGTVFTGRVAEGPVGVGEPILVQTASLEIRASVDGLESHRQSVPRAEVGQDIGVLCYRVPIEAFNDCYVGEGEVQRPMGLVLVSAPKRWWEFWRA